MASLTPNLNLYKPDRTEYVSVISDINNNMDVLDEAYENISQVVANTNNLVDISSEITFSNVPSGTTYSTTISNIKAYRTGNVVNITFDIEFSPYMSAGGGIAFNYSLTENLRPILDAPCVGITGSFLGKMSRWNDSQLWILLECLKDDTAADTISIQYICKGVPNSINVPVVDDNVTPTLISGDDYSMNF